MPDFLLLLLPLLCLWGLRPAKPLASQLNTDCLSPERTASVRGLMALAVIFIHLGQYTVGGPVLALLPRFGYLIVAVFFFLSGYSLQAQHIQKENYAKGFLLRRLRLMVLPYVVLTGIYWSYFLWLGRDYDLRYVLTRFWTGNPLVSFSWYILAILSFYVAFWVLMRLCKRNYKAMLLGGLLWYALHTTVCVLLNFGSWWYLSALCAVAGMAWAVYKEKIEAFLRKAYFPATAGVFIALAVSFILDLLISLPVLSSVVKTASAVLIAVAVLLVLYKVRFGNPLLHYLGQMSMELYLTQGLAMMVIRSRLIFVENHLLYSILVFPITVLFSTVVYIAFKGLPKTLRKKKAPKRKASLK